jgi:ABC-2 type transport system permease protein
MNWHRISGLILRYRYLYSRSTFRLLDLFFWPTMDLLVWGFLTTYMMRVNGTMPAAVTFLIGAIIFWDVLYRSQQAVAVSFLEDIWSSNLLNIFIAPIRISEFIAATYCVGLFQAIIVVVLTSTMAFFFYSFNIFTIGVGLVPYLINLLLMGWWMGMITTALIIRWGHSAEALAWAVPYLVQPVAAVFYPVTVLPAWLQPVAWCMPATHVFEGMRAAIRGEPLDPMRLVWAFGLNVFYMILCAWFFRKMFDIARNRGLLAKIAL